MKRTLKKECHIKVGNMGAIRIGTKKKSKWIVVDDEDEKRIRQYTWWLTCKNTTGSFIIMGQINEKEVNITNFIMNDYNNMYDHKDRNCSNNKKENLRPCNKSLNAANIGPRNGQKYKGVSLIKSTGKWGVNICYLNKTINGGTFNTDIEAAKARDKIVKRLFGEFAYLNFPEEK